MFINFKQDDEPDMMKGKIKPKEKDPEPEVPTLRKRPVTKDKVDICFESANEQNTK